MNLGLNTLAQQCTGLLFSLADLVREVLFVRPPGLNSATGVFSAEEAIVPARMALLNYRPVELTDPVIQLDHDKVIVRGADLAGITAPGIGDYLIDSLSGQRRNILAGRYDELGQFWLFAARQTLDEDWGGLGAAIAFADRGDLTPTTEMEDCGSLN